jgi:adenine-specific DNA-methyltransferase
MPKLGTKLESKTADLIAENITKLRELFPEAFAEGKIDFETLRLVLGDEVETESERYSFTWHGKTDAIKLALKQSTGTLKPCKEESKDWDATKNIFIEGDNLEVLKILQASYRNKIKMIYIDPPYNTGTDFIYEDDFKDPIKNYKEKIGEVGKANPETAGRYHTNWLNMMYPRLRLARNLLKEDGVIFISIDDNEVHNLRKICDEIFGEENFVCDFVWKR